MTETKDWGGFGFTRIATLDPQRDVNGAPLEFMPQARYAKAAASSLNVHGAGPFCRFAIPRTHDRRRWRTRVELANAIFEYLEMFHNRKRRHSSLGMRTPIEFEKMHAYPTAGSSRVACGARRRRRTGSPTWRPGHRTWT